MRLLLSSIRANQSSPSMNMKKDLPTWHQQWGNVAQIMLRQLSEQAYGRTLEISRQLSRCRDRAFLGALLHYALLQRRPNRA
jgi:hypothetical protein